jgi:DNA-binding response OmpR family regulator
VARRVREISAVPIIMLTARNNETDIVRGFDVGADDYLTKPFSVNELVVRVRAVIRRTKYPEEVMNRQPLVTGQISIDFAQHRVLVRGQEVALTPLEYRLLSYLASNQGRVMLHADILRHVWGPEYREESEYLRVYVRYLRQKIEQDPSAPQHIITKPGAGYMFQAAEELPSKA